jgi:hypothetical protein
MKKLYILITFLLTVFVSYGQQADTVFTSDQLVRIYEYIDSLETEIEILSRKNELNLRLAEQYKYNNSQLNDLVDYNERYIAVRNAQYALLEKNIESYQEYIKTTKRPFWDKPIVWFIVGAGTIYFSSTIVANVK